VTTSQIVILSLLMLVTGAIGAITGGNSLINVPLMITVGMSPREAVATNMFAVTFMTISATARFARARLLRWNLLVPLGVITIITSALGAVIAVKLSEVVVKLVVGISMGALVVFMAVYQKKEPPTPTPARRQAGWIGSAVLGIYGGFFSGGYTTLMTALCTACFGLTMMESVAVTKPVNLVSCAAASVIFFMGGVIDLRVGLPLAAANLIGGWIGAHAALKGGDRFVRLFFQLTVAALAIKLVAWDVLRRL
jgi:uncharacterized membrane protein YfcA